MKVLVLPRMPDQPSPVPPQPTSYPFRLPRFPHMNRVSSYSHAQVFPLRDALLHINRPFAVAVRDNGLEIVRESSAGTIPVPACPLENLGDGSFCRDMGIRYPYAGGSMAKGISSAAMVEELATAGMLCFFGAAGLPLAEVERAIRRLAPLRNGCGFNLIHSPQEPALESALVDLYLRLGVNLVEASAFLNLTLPIVRYREIGRASCRERV